MPQMSPLLWFILFLFFSLIYIFSTVKVYFSTPSLTPQTKKLDSMNLETNKMDWKW